MRLRFRKLAMRGGKGKREGGCFFFRWLRFLPSPSPATPTAEDDKATFLFRPCDVVHSGCTLALLALCVVISTEQFHLELSYLARKEVNYDNRF